MTDSHCAAPHQWREIEDAAKLGSTNCAAISELRARVEALEASVKGGKPCPYIRSSDEGTSYCALAEKGVPATVMDSLTVHPAQPRTEQQAAQAPADSLVERVRLAIKKEDWMNNGLDESVCDDEDPTFRYTSAAYCEGYDVLSEQARAAIFEVAEYLKNRGEEEVADCLYKAL